MFFWMLLQKSEFDRLWLSTDVVRTFPWSVRCYYCASLLRIALVNGMHGVSAEHANATPVATGPSSCESLCGQDQKINAWHGVCCCSTGGAENESL